MTEEQIVNRTLPGLIAGPPAAAFVVCAGAWAWSRCVDALNREGEHPTVMVSGTAAWWVAS